MISLKRYTLFLVLAFVLTATATSALRSQTATTSSPARVNQLDSPDQLDVPIADLGVPETVEPDKKAKRLLRGKRHNLRNKNLTAEDVKRFAVREEDSPVNLSPAAGARAQTPSRDVTVNEEQLVPPVIGGAVTEHTPPEQPFPVSTSDVVVVGEVTKASAYLSEDKTSVFSEFTTNVKEVLTSNGSHQVRAGSSLAVLRPGGGVRFPSGRVRLYNVEGRTYPRAGRSYVLFLKYDAIDQSFYVVTGYELRDGKVFPLDGVPRGGNEHHPLARYSKYKGMDEAAFMDELRREIASPAQQTNLDNSDSLAGGQESAK